MLCQHCLCVGSVCKNVLLGLIQIIFTNLGYFAGLSLDDTNTEKHAEFLVPNTVIIMFEQLRRKRLVVLNRNK